MDNIDIIKIINKWTEFSEWNKEQKTFNLLSSNYFFHSNNEKIYDIYNKYPNVQNLMLLQFKNIFLYYLKNATISLYDAITDNYKNLKEVIEMNELFNCEIIKSIETSLFNKIEDLHKYFYKDFAIGQTETEDYMDSLDVVFSDFNKLKIDVYKKGENINPVMFCTEIYVFNTLAECLLVLEKSKDMGYLCYINQNNTADGYFGVFIKSNGNIFSVNERLYETYIGQHNNRRNNRYTEEKCYDLFPYSSFDFKNYDYLGYSRTIIYNKDLLNFYDISPKEKNNLIILFIFISLCFFNSNLQNEEIVYSNYFLKENIKRYFDIKALSLIPYKESSIMNTTQNLNFNISADDIKNGTKHEKYKFNNLKQIFIDLYAPDYVINMDSLLNDESILNIKFLQSNDKNNDDIKINSEFVATKEKYELELYYEGRKQLANYVKAQMKEELKRFSLKYTGIEDNRNCGAIWYEQALNKNKDHVIQFLVQLYVNYINEIKDDRIVISDTYAWNSNVINKNKNFNKFLCDINGKPCNIYINFTPKDYMDIEFLIGEEVPKIIKGYSAEWEYNGNSILDTVDYVSKLQTPFEARGSFSYDPYREDFICTIGFSKSGLRKYIKEHNIKPQGRK